MDGREQDEARKGSRGEVSRSGLFLAGRLCRKRPFLLFCFFSFVDLFLWHYTSFVYWTHGVPFPTQLPSLLLFLSQVSPFELLIFNSVSYPSVQSSCIYLLEHYSEFQCFYIVQSINTHLCRDFHSGFSFKEGRGNHYYECVGQCPFSVQGAAREVLCLPSEGKFYLDNQRENVLLGLISASDLCKTPGTHSWPSWFSQEGILHRVLHSGNQMHGLLETLRL